MDQAYYERILLNQPFVNIYKGIFGVCFANWCFFAGVRNRGREEACSLPLVNKGAPVGAPFGVSYL
jgi:hypothetical protein